MPSRTLVCLCLCGCMRVLMPRVLAVRVCRMFAHVLAAVLACVVHVVVHRVVCVPAVLCQCVFACLFACVRSVLVARLVACACCWCWLARACHNDADCGARQPAGALKFVANCWFPRFSFEVQFWS